MNEKGELIAINERTRIEKHDGGIAFTEDDGETWNFVPADTTVSMNMWGFTKSILKEIEEGFPAFLDKGLKENPMKCEYLPADGCQQSSGRGPGNRCSPQVRG